MKRILPLLLLLLTNLAMADPRPQLSDYAALFASPANNAQLQQLQQQLLLDEASRGEFQQTRWLQVLKQPLQSHGRFIFAADEGMLWQQQQPFDSTLILKQQQLIQIDSQGQMTIQSADNGSPLSSLLPRLMQALLSADMAYLQQHFSLYLQSGNPWQLGLIAKDAQLQTLLPKLVLQGNAQPQQLLMLTSNGDISDLRFSHIRQGPLSDDERRALAVTREPR
ncbi:outer membrane lipoprotein carrier protein LolA [Shewanella sp. YIC-542]|uniref:outer membrane lipoprotein carrier protein LolA n=1 Tax=Shewanella mytili TaxID=3377111 RepID=UPI00398F3ECB